MTTTITTQQSPADAPRAPLAERPPVLAIDASLTGFAWRASWYAGPEGALHFSDAGEHSSAPAGPTPRQRVDRIERLLRNLEPIVQHIPNAGDCGGLCLIEGYAYGARNKGHDLGELGGLLRCWVLDHWCGAVVECSPGQVKRFATGRGNASKVQVASALASRYGVEFATDNEADAFGILQLGRCVVGQLEPETKAQRAVVADLRVAYEAELDEVSA